MRVIFLMLCILVEVFTSFYFGLRALGCIPGEFSTTKCTVGSVISGLIAVLFIYMLWNLG